MGKKKKEKSPMEKVRKPIPKPNQIFPDKTKYRRKKKHPKDLDY